MVTRLGSLQDATLNETQAEAVRVLHAGILALAERDAMRAPVDMAGYLG